MLYFMIYDLGKKSCCSDTNTEIALWFRSRIQKPGFGRKLHLPLTLHPNAQYQTLFNSTVLSSTYLSKK